MVVTVTSTLPCPEDLCGDPCLCHSPRHLRHTPRHHGVVILSSSLALTPASSLSTLRRISAGPFAVPALPPPRRSSPSLRRSPSRGGPTVGLSSPLDCSSFERLGRPGLGATPRGADSHPPPAAVRLLLSSPTCAPRDATKT